MKIKHYLLAFLLSSTLGGFAQKAPSERSAAHSTVSEFKFESESLQELRDFDWTLVERIFEENRAEDSIHLVFAYSNPNETNAGERGFEHFEIALSGPTANLDKMKASLHKSLARLEWESPEGQE